jgi:hypothetical protein
MGNIGGRKTSTHMLASMMEEWSVAGFSWSLLHIRIINLADASEGRDITFPSSDP